MGYNIRPMSFGEVLDRAFVVLRNHFWSIVGISAVFFLPYGLLNGFAQVASGHLLRTAISLSALLFVVIAGPLAAVAIETAIAGVYIEEPITAGEAYRSASSFLGRIIGTYIILVVLLILSFVALIVPGAYFLICWQLIIPVMVVENRFGIAALRRSRELVRGVWWRTLGIVLIAEMAQLPAFAFQFFWGHIPFLGPILGNAMLAVTASYTCVIFIVYYFDRRCRTEDFDLRLLAAQIRGEAKTATHPMPRTSPVA